MRAVISERKFSRSLRQGKEPGDVVRIYGKSGQIGKDLEWSKPAGKDEVFEVQSPWINMQIYSRSNSGDENLPNDQISSRFEYFIPNKTDINYIFPPNFFWGAAMSAFQTEGNTTNTDWWDFAEQGKCKNKDKIGKATDHYTRYEEDFKIAKEIGLNMLRIGIEWARIEPKKGKWNKDEIEHYRKVLVALRECGIEPMVTLFHFSQPNWFVQEGGFEKEKNIQYFSNYVKKIATEFKDLVTYYITINEPTTFVMGGWITGTLPPGKNDAFDGTAWSVWGNCMKAHAQAYKTIHDVYKDKDPKASNEDCKNVKVSVAHHMRDMQSYTDKPEYKAACKLADELTNQMFLNAILEGKIEIKNKDFSCKDKCPPINIHGLKGSLDFFGLNYYTRDRVTDGSILWFKGFNVVYHPEQYEYTPMGEKWEYAPDGMYNVLMSLKKFSEDFNAECGKKLDGIIITENGVGDVSDTGLAAETMRSRFLLDHLYYLWKAINHKDKDGNPDGADVRGYLHWSLLDNFELAEGYRAQFGLIGVDCRKDPGLKRTWKDSAYLYQQIIKDNGLTNAVKDFVK